MIQFYGILAQNLYQNLWRALLIYWRNKSLFGGAQDPPNPRSNEHSQFRTLSVVPERSSIIWYGIIDTSRSSFQRLTSAWRISFEVKQYKNDTITP